MDMQAPRPAAPAHSVHPQGAHPAAAPAAHAAPQAHSALTPPRPIQQPHPHTVTAPQAHHQVHAPAATATTSAFAQQPRHTAVSPQHQSQPNYTQSIQPVAQPQPLPHTQPTQPVAQPAHPSPHTDAFDAGQNTDQHSRAHKGPHPTGHAGLVGFAVFVVFAILFFAPLLPGKIWDNAPGSSASFSTGDQNIDCLGTLGKTTTTTSYDLRIGFPLVYDYSTTSHISATCGGQLQRAVGGHTSQFNPLALAADAILALALAIVASKLWRRFRGVRD